MELKVYDSYGKCGPADTPQELGHACVTTGRRGFSLPSFSRRLSAHRMESEQPGVELSTLLFTDL